MRTSRTLVIALSVAAGVLAGCSTTVPPSRDAWSKPGSTEEERGRDQLTCLNQAGGPGRINQTRYRQCMQDLGYSSEAAPK